MAQDPTKTADALVKHGVELGPHRSRLLAIMDTTIHTDRYIKAFMADDTIAEVGDRVDALLVTQETGIVPSKVRDLYAQGWGISDIPELKDAKEDVSTYDEPATRYDLRGGGKTVIGKKGFGNHISYDAFTFLDDLMGGERDTQQVFETLSEMKDLLKEEAPHLGLAVLIHKMKGLQKEGDKIGRHYTPHGLMLAAAKAVPALPSAEYDG